MLVIAKYLNNNEVEENLLLCHFLLEQTTGEDIFNALVCYFGLCTDGGKLMSDIYSGFWGRVMKVVFNINWSHYYIHWQSLASKNLPGELKLDLDEAIKLVNFIKARSTYSKILKALCEDIIISPHSTLLFHTEVRYLSYGKVLTRLFELRHKIQVFFWKNRPFQLASKLHDCYWLQALAYLFDIFL